MKKTDIDPFHRLLRCLVLFYSICEEVFILMIPSWKEIWRYYYSIVCMLFCWYSVFWPAIWLSQWRGSGLTNTHCYICPAIALLLPSNGLCLLPCALCIIVVLNRRYVWLHCIYMVCWLEAGGLHVWAPCASILLHACGTWTTLSQTYLQRRRNTPCPVVTFFPILPVCAVETAPGVGLFWAFAFLPHYHLLKSCIWNSVVRWTTILNLGREHELLPIVVLRGWRNLCGPAEEEHYCIVIVIVIIVLYLVLLIYCCCCCCCCCWLLLMVWYNVLLW